MKVIYNILEIREPVLYHNKKDTHIYGAIPEECDDLKKVMKEMLSLLIGNGILNILYERA